MSLQALRKARVTTAMFKGMEKAVCSNAII